MQITERIEGTTAGSRCPVGRPPADHCANLLAHQALTDRELTAPEADRR